MDHYRKARRALSREQRLEEGCDIADGPADHPCQGASLEELLAPLPVSQREVIAMLKVSGMSLEEVARATASSVGSVKQKAHRAYDTLRKTLAGVGVAKGRGGAGS